MAFELIGLERNRELIGRAAASACQTIYPHSAPQSHSGGAALLFFEPCPSTTIYAPPCSGATDPEDGQGCLGWAWPQVAILQEELGCKVAGPYRQPQ